MQGENSTKNEQVKSKVREVKQNLNDALTLIREMKEIQANSSELPKEILGKKCKELGEIIDTARNGISYLSELQ